MPLVAGKTGLSPSLLNKGFIFEGTGAEIAALGSSTGVQVARCTISGSGFAADEVYFRKVDGTWLPLNQIRHTHDQNDDDSGGLFSNILYANTNNVYRQEQWGWFGNVMLNEFTGSGAGIFADITTGSTKLSTANIATSYVNMKKSGRKHDWASPSRVDYRLRVDSSTQIITRAGVCSDSLSGSNTSTAQYGIEFCDSTGINWQICSASGSVRSIMGTTAPGSTSAAQYYRIEHFPGSGGSIKLTTGMSTSPFWVKTSDPPPATGASRGDSNTLSMGVKTSDTTVKNLYVWGFTFVSTPSFIDV